MYNVKSRTSAILTIVTAVLLIGFMVLIPFLRYKVENNDGQEALTALFVTIISFIGCSSIYLSAISFAVVGLIFGIKMLKQQSKEMLIFYNVRMLITTCVLLLSLAWGFILSYALIFNSTLELLPVIYTIAIALAYIATLVTQIVTINALKHSH